MDTEMYGLMTNLLITEEEDYYGPCRYKKIDLVSSCVDITVRGFVAHLSLDLTYRNTYGQTLEVTYTCPVDAKSAIFEFRAELNGRTIHAHCVEKKKAEELYKDAVSKGQSAIIASEAQESADVLKLSLGNLDEDETALLHLEMVMELPVGTDGGVTFTLPLVFNPRYSSSSEIGSPQPVEATPDAAQLLLSKTDIKAKVIGSLKIDRIVSTKSTFNTNLNEEGTEAELNEFRIYQQGKDWEFQIYYNSPHQPHVLKETCDRSSSGMMADDVLMLNLFPEIPIDGFSPHNEIIFVVDCSGSMEGDSIKKAKTTLMLFLKSLPQGCRFNIVCFGSSFNQLFEASGSERYTEENLKKALKYHKNIDANLGGTEIYRPLEDIYSQSPTPGYGRQILLLTDGEVWNVNEVVGLVSRNSGDTRLFSVGIGDGASTALVQGVAQAGKGRHEMVTDSKQLQSKVMGLIASMLQHNVTDVKVNVKLDVEMDVALIPNVPPVIFGGQHLILYARVPPKSSVKSVCITGKVGDKSVSYDIKEGDCKEIHDAKLSLHRIAAKKQITEWQLTNKGNNEELLGLSIASSVVCRLTALVGIDLEGKSYKEKPEKSLDLSDLYAAMRPPPYTCPKMMPPMPVMLSNPVESCFMEDFNDESCSMEDCDDMGFSLYDACIPESQVIHRSPMKHSSYIPRGFRAQCAGIESPEEDECSSSVPESPEDDSLLNVIIEQNFDGSWNLEICSTTLKLSLELMKQLENIKKEFNLNDVNFATAICLSWFRAYHLERKQEWDFISIKGSTFLASNGLDVSKIVDKCVALLSSTKD